MCSLITACGSISDSLEILATPETQVIVAVTVGVRQPRVVPHQSAPAAVVLMRFAMGENEPTALHLGFSGAAAAAEFFGREREIHVLGGIAVLVVHDERAHALGERAGGIGVAAALLPTA